MPEFQSTSPKLEMPQNQRLLAHWESLRKGGQLPLRTDFNPMVVPALLPNMMVLEPHLPATATVRSFGTELAHRLGMDLTGEDLLSLYSDDRQELAQELVHTIVDARVVAVASSEWTTPSGHTYETENLWLPLVSETGEIIRILGSLWEVHEVRADVDDLGGSIDDSQKLARRVFYRLPDDEKVPS